MLEKYIVTHAPTGRSVVVLDYTPEEAHKKGLAQLQKVVGVANPGRPALAAVPVPPAHANNTTVAKAAAPVTLLTTKHQTPAAPAPTKH